MLYTGHDYDVCCVLRVIVCTVSDYDVLCGVLHVIIKFCECTMTHYDVLDSVLQ